MSDLTKQLKPFERRVRLVRAWKGLAIGLCIGAAGSSIWAVCDWRSILYTEWSWMAVLTAVSGAIGGLIGFALKIASEALAISIDRRAGLKDRLTTANERLGAGDTFDQALQADAEKQLAAVQPTNAFPIRFGRWHAAALFFGILAAAIFMLGNTPIVLGEQGRKDREELKKDGETVKRIAKENFETPEARSEMSEADKKLADELRRFDRDLEKAHLSKEEALQKANELAQKADELTQQASKTEEASLAQAETAGQQAAAAEMAKAGLSGMSPEMAQMGDSDKGRQLDQLRKESKQLQDRLQALKRELAEILKQLERKDLSPEERKKLEARKAEIEKEIADITKQLKANTEQEKELELSKEAQDVFQRMMNDPKFKELVELQKMLSQGQKASSASGQPKLTKEELQKMKEALERLAKQLKDKKAMQAYLQALMDALLKAKEMNRLSQTGMGIRGAFGTMPPPPGPGDTTPGVWTGDTGRINKLNSPTASKGTTTTDVISGDPRPSDGPQPYVEIRAPSTVGNRTSVPYKDVLPSYERKAESALNRQQIPKEHQRRVKEYFDSLTGAAKQ